MYVKNPTVCVCVRVRVVHESVSTLQNSGAPRDLHLQIGPALLILVKDKLLWSLQTWSHPQVSGFCKLAAPSKCKLIVVSPCFSYKKENYFGRQGGGRRLSALFMINSKRKLREATRPQAASKTVKSLKSQTEFSS
jgi:hypothetical protein